MNHVCIRIPENGAFLTKIQLRKKILGSFYEKIYNDKMSEPLLNGVSYTYHLPINSEREDRTNNINIHSHGHFTDRVTSFYPNNVYVNTLHGKIKVYKTICKTFPYCSINKEIIQSEITKEGFYTDFQSLYNQEGNFFLSIIPSDDYHSMSNKQNIIIVECIESDTKECSYEIKFSSQELVYHLYNQMKVSKYLSIYREISFNNELFNTKTIMQYIQIIILS